MPKYLDHHKTVQMPPEMAQMAVEKLKSGQSDEFGVTGINAFVGETETWCVTDVPNPEAVHKSHEAMGIDLGAGKVTEVQALV